MTFDLFRVDDSFAELRSMPERAFDIVLTDPPYNDHVQKNQISGTSMAAHVAGGSGAVPHVDLPFAPLAGYDFAADLVRVASRWALSFCAVEDFGEFKRAVKEDYVRSGLFIKMNAMGQLTGDRPAASYEGIAIMHRAEKKRWNGRGSYGWWPCNSTRGKVDRHPNEKPLLLCLKLVALFSERGETILDPFCGSSAIGEAAVLLGRNYVGFDLPQRPVTPQEYWTQVGGKGRLALAQGLPDPKGAARSARVPKELVERCSGQLSVDWIARSAERLSAASLAAPWTDEAALKLCTAKKAEILESEVDDELEGT